MYEDDYLLRQIRRFGEAVARWLRGERDRESLAEVFREAVGMDPATVDRLPIEALLAMHDPDDPRTTDRLRVVATWYELTAGEGPLDPRRLRAARLRAAVGELPASAKPWS
jgi:hypothetical protein